MTSSGVEVNESASYPRLRGLLHAIGAPIVVIAGVVLVLTASDGVARTAGIVFTVATFVNFSASAAMHRGRWGRRMRAFVARVDHVSIFLLIAGSYTAFALLLLQGDARIAMLVTAWGGALIGISVRLFWFGAPRWVHTSAYLILGWLAVFYAGDFASFHNSAVPVLLAVGGVCYSLGGLVYGTRRPDPWPRWYGFHEVFHTLAILGFVAHYAALYIAVNG